MSAIAAAAPASANPLLQRLDATRESPLFYKIFALVSAGMMLDALDVYLASSVTSTVLKQGWSTLQLNSYFLSAGFLGLFIGSIASGYVGDLAGRRVAYQVNLLVFGGFTLAGAFAPSMAWLIVCRFFAGVGLGSEIVTGYALVNEFAPIHRRGRWCAATSVIANTGAPVTMLASALVIPRFGWRVMFVAVGVLAGILWYLRRDIPESPRWLIAHGRAEEARGIVEQLEAGGRAARPEAAHGGTPADQPVHRPAHAVCLMVGIVAASATIVCQYTFTSWVPTLLVRRGISISGSLGLSTFMMLGAPLGCLIGAWCVDRLGRKPTIVAAFAATAVFGVLYGAQHAELGAVLVGFALTTCFYVLMASVIAVYVAELFPTRVRFRGAGICNAVAKLLTVAMPIAVAWMLGFAPEWTVFASISAFALVACAVVWIWGPETNRRLLG